MNKKYSTKILELVNLVGGKIARWGGQQTGTHRWATGGRCGTGRRVGGQVGRSEDRYAQVGYR